MLGFRTLTCLTLAVTAIAGVIGLRPTIISRAGSGPEEAAWALLAETDELCASAAGSVARLAIAEESLEIVRELTTAIGSAATRTSLLGTAERLERRCVDGVPSTPHNLLTGGLASGGARVSLDGLGRQERAAVIGSYLERLNHAVSEALEHRDQPAFATPVPLAQLAPVVPLARLDPVPSASAAPRSEPEVDRSAESEPFSGVENPHPRLRPGQASGPPAIVIERTTQKHRRSVTRWSRVFQREAGALRTSRRDLQVEIRRHSMTRSRAACRAFESTLAGLDSEFEEGAPSRGLSRRIARMVGRYRRGVVECMAGRPAAAFAYLSEGDREWALVAQNAAGMFAPRPLRSRDGESPVSRARGGS